MKSSVIRTAACALLPCVHSLLSAAPPTRLVRPGRTILGGIAYSQTRSYPFLDSSPFRSLITKATTSDMSHDSSTKEPRKAGVASPEQLQAFVDQAGDRLLVIDARNPDPVIEPSDQVSLVVAGVPNGSYRPKARNLVWDRKSQSMPVPDDVPKDTPIITHCGGGGRGQLAKDYLEQQGFTNVLNGGGPKETDCWDVYGDK